MKKLLIPGIITVLLSSCMSLNQFVVTRVGEEPSGYSGRFVYSLPQTVLEVKVNMVKTIYLPGPYRQFSEKYLGILNYIREEKTQWEIEGIQVTERSEPDPLQYYSVNLLRGSFTGGAYLKLSNNGLVIDPMGMISTYNLIPPKIQMDIPAVLELSMKKSHEEKVDTLFKTIITDSSFVKIPILRKQKEAKTLEQKAEEAANLIIKIRKRRLKLVTGEYAVFPEGIALEKAISELNKTEREYIALFTGKIYREKFSKSILLVPTGGEEKIDFMKFSSTKGVLPLGSTDGKVVTMELIPDTGLPSGLINNDKDRKSLKNTLYFRVPSTCNVRVTESDDLLFEGRISVFQAGTMFPLPVMKKK